MMGKPPKRSRNQRYLLTDSHISILLAFHHTHVLQYCTPPLFPKVDQFMFIPQGRNTQIKNKKPVLMYCSDSSDDDRRRVRKSQVSSGTGNISYLCHICFCYFLSILLLCNCIYISGCQLLLCFLACRKSSQQPQRGLCC